MSLKFYVPFTTEEEEQQPMTAAQQQPEQRSLGINVGSNTGELQGILIQLGRIADILQKIADEYKANPVRPQPFTGQ